METSSKLAMTAAVAVAEGEEIEEQTPAPIYGDILAAILSRLSFIHLVRASTVSKTWCRAVYSYLGSSTRRKPWLIVYSQSTRSPNATTAHAYDASSNIWIRINQPSIDYVSALRSTHLNLIYMISASKMSFSFDPLHLTWHHATSPTVCRIDPVVALVGNRIVVAGGACDFEDDSLAVEVYDIFTCTWTTCKSMPESLKCSASSSWLSVAVNENENKLYLTEKSSDCGITYIFNLDTFTWTGPLSLIPTPTIFSSVTGFVNGRLMLIGLTVEIDGSNPVKVWEVDCDTFECVNVGEMPAALVENLRGECFQISSIEVRLAGNFAYIYKPASVHEDVITCEFVDGGGCRWGNVENAAVNDRNLMDRFVFTCSEVGMEELQKAVRISRRSFTVV